MYATVSNGDILTRCDRLWGRGCLAYNLQAHLPATALALLSRMQQCLEREISVPINVVPEHALHISLYAVVPYSWPDDGKEAFWESRRERLLQSLPDLSRECSVLELDVESSIIFPTAVVATIRERTGTIRSMRERLAELCRHPTWPHPSYDMLHCTLGRFAEDGTVSALEAERYQAHWQRFSTPLRALALVRERRYPALEVDDIARVTL